MVAFLDQEGALVLNRRDIRRGQAGRTGAQYDQVIRLVPLRGPKHEFIIFHRRHVQYFDLIELSNFESLFNSHSMAIQKQAGASVNPDRNGAV